MDHYIYRAGNAACFMEHLEFEIHSLSPGEGFRGETGSREGALTALVGSCVFSAKGDRRTIGGRKSIFEGRSPHVAFLPPECAFEVTAVTPLTFSLAKGTPGGELKSVLHVETGSVQGFQRGEGKTRREIYELTPPEPRIKLMVFEVFTPEGNWSSFPPHKHDVETEQESFLQETYYFSFDPTEGFALLWLSDDRGDLDNAYSVRDGDLAAIPHGYHTMCVSPGYACSTHCVMAGPSDTWKISVKPEYKHLLNWKR